jgi:predicted aspartyl protease
MKLSLRHNLPFLAVAVAYQGKAATIADVLVDTGSASTILAADTLAEIGLFQAPTDRLYAIGGVGGSEFVFGRQVDFLEVDNRRLSDFRIEVGGMDYGFEINGILGMDFLTQAGAIINLRELCIEFAD